jgi:hypothetical protein
LINLRDFRKQKRFVILLVDAKVDDRKVKEMMEEDKYYWLLR